MPAEDARPATRLSAGVVVVNVQRPTARFLLLRAYKNWDFPQGIVEAGEDPITAALREVREETTLDNLSFDWGMRYIDTGPYNKGKISRYYLARSIETKVSLPVNPHLGRPEPHEARWAESAQALGMVSPRLEPVVRWARDTIRF